MTEIEKMIRLVMDNFYTSLPCKILEYDENSRFARCKLEIKTIKEGETPLVRVPILRMVGGSVPLQVGMVIPVWFTKYALGDYLATLNEVSVKDCLKEIQFTRNNAYGLPFLFDEKLNIKMPDFVEFDTKVIFKEEVVFEKKVDMLATLKVLESVDTGKIIAENYDNHTHTSSKPGDPTSSPLIVSRGFKWKV